MILLMYLTLSVPFLSLLLAIFVGFLVFNYNYKKCSYYRNTSLPFLSVISDKGRLGEYMTYKKLKNYEAQGAKFLFNVYIPKENEETTEIDVLMICRKGIFTFESKNYSGWIFGNEWQKNWYQTLPSGKGRSRKEIFFNPVMQNKSHIKHLRKLIDESIPIWSIIVFSERCTLKKIEISSNDVVVIKRDQILFPVSLIFKNATDFLSDMEITDIYNKLLPYTQVNDTIKQNHISNVQKLYSKIDNASEAGVSQTAIAETNAETKFQEEAWNCPKCGALLVLRTAKRGANIGKEFYGCSNYPKCRYIRNRLI